MKKLFLALAIAMLIPMHVYAWGFNLGDYKVNSDNKLMFIHHDGNPTLLNEINYENYTYFGIRALDLYLHFDGYADVSAQEDLNFYKPRSIFSSSNLGKWSTWIGVGSTIGPATFEVYQIYSDVNSGDIPTNLAVGFTF